MMLGTEQLAFRLITADAAELALLGAPAVNPHDCNVSPNVQLEEIA